MPGTLFLPPLIVKRVKGLGDPVVLPGLPNPHKTRLAIVSASEERQLIEDERLAQEEERRRIEEEEAAPAAEQPALLRACN